MDLPCVVPTTDKINDGQRSDSGPPTTSIDIVHAEPSLQNCCDVSDSISSPWSTRVGLEHCGVRWPMASDLRRLAKSCDDHDAHAAHEANARTHHIRQDSRVRMPNTPGGSCFRRRDVGHATQVAVTLWISGCACDSKRLCWSELILPLCMQCSSFSSQVATSDTELMNSPLIAPQFSRPCRAPTWNVGCLALTLACVICVF